MSWEASLSTRYPQFEEPTLSRQTLAIHTVLQEPTRSIKWKHYYRNPQTSEEHATNFVFSFILAEAQQSDYPMFLQLSL